MLSILTNFGCHFSCSYCVYKNNQINIPFTTHDTFGWNQLEEELKKHQGEEVSISGGGDPLYNYDEKQENKWFYDKLFELLDKYDCTLEMHTSILSSSFPYTKCKRVVFHFSMPTQINMLYWRHSLIKLPDNVRVVYVVQPHYTKYIINQIVQQVKSNEEINELSFRQMINADGTVDNTLYDYLKAGHMNDWYYIEQCDYNEYFVQDHMEREYLSIK